MKQFDLCVIGSGPAGYASVMRAMDFGKRVALVEKDKIGGAGIWNGALSSKTLWELSKSYKLTHENSFGFTVLESDLNFSSVMFEMNKAVNERYMQLKAQIDYYVKKKRLYFIQGHGKLISKNEILIQKNEFEEETIWADNTILAIGSKPRKLPNIPIDEEIIVTSDGIHRLKEFPESLVILGAGVIGCEFATIFSNFGKTKVFLIDKEERILPFEDEDLSYTVAKNLEANGVTIHRLSSLEKMEIVDGKVEYTLSYKDGRKEIRTVDKALVSIGRTPNIENLGCEDIGINLNERGCCIDDATQTSVPNVYAVGDFTADIALVNVGVLEARYAVERIFGQTSRDLHYENISSIMFLTPEVAACGLNELQARRQNIPYKVAILNYQYVNRAIAMRKTKGFFKLMVTDDEKMQLLGIRVLGPHASSTIEAVSLLINLKMGVDQLAELIFPHPSIPEGLQECARMLMGKSIIKPEVFSASIKCYSVSADGRIKDM